MPTDLMRKTLTVVRLNSGQKILEQFESIPVILIGVCTNGISKGQTFMFSLDGNLSAKENLALIDNVRDILLHQITNEKV